MVVPHGLRYFRSLFRDDKLGLPCGSFSPSHPIFLACREKCYFPFRFLPYLRIGSMFPPIKGHGGRGRQAGGWTVINGFQAGYSALHSCPGSSSLCAAHKGTEAQKEQQVACIRDWGSLYSQVTNPWEANPRRFILKWG